MEFSIENLRALLEESKSLKLMHDEERLAFMKKVMASNEVKQRKVFQTLIEVKAEIEEAEKKYKQVVADAVDEYAVGVKELEKKTLHAIRKQAEEKETVKEHKEMDSLLSNLNTL